MYNDVYRANTGSRAMTLILDCLCQILCNKTPKGVVAFRPDALIPKIKLVSPPRGVEVERRVVVEKVSISSEHPTGEKETVFEKNTNERAIVRIMVPKRTMTLSEVNAEKEKPAEEGSEGPTSPASKKEEEAEENKGEESATPAEPKSPLSAKSGEEAAKEGSQQNVSRLSRVPSERIIEQD